MRGGGGGGGGRLSTSEGATPDILGIGAEGGIFVGTTLLWSGSCCEEVPKASLMRGGGRRAPLFSAGLRIVSMGGGGGKKSGEGLSLPMLSGVAILLIDIDMLRRYSLISLASSSVYKFR